MGSMQKVIQYDDIRAVTPAASGSDANGPFAGLLVSSAGNLTVITYTGKTVGPIAVIAGQELRFPVRLVVNSTTATVFGLVAATIAQGT